MAKVTRKYPTKSKEQRKAEMAQHLENLEKGTIEIFNSGRYSEYLRVMSKFHNYSVNNCLMILMQCPFATHVAGYGAWKKEFKRQVRKGEKAITILAPCPYKIKEQGENGEEIEKIIPYFKAVSVFDISQTDGEELPTICRSLNGDIENFNDFFICLRKSAPCEISFEEIDGGCHGYYDIQGKRIAIKNGMSQEQTIKTTIHEIAHSILHSEADNEKERRQKEVEAESVAYVVCSHYGIDTSEYSFGYVASWSSDKNVKELKKSLETIRDTANKLIDSIDKYFD